MHPWYGRPDLGIDLNRKGECDNDLVQKVSHSNSPVGAAIAPGVIWIIWCINTLKKCNVSVFGGKPIFTRFLKYCFVGRD